MHLFLAVLWLVFWISGVALALFYANIPNPIFGPDGQSRNVIAEPEQAMLCIMLHTVLCMPMVATFLEKALGSDGARKPTLKPAVYWIFGGLHLAVLIVIASFLAKGLFVALSDGRDALDHFVNGTGYGGFLSATVLLLVGALISMGEHAAKHIETESGASDA